MKKGFMPAVILLVICVACTALLAITNEVTFEARAEQREIQANADRLALFASAASFDPVDAGDDCASVFLAKEDGSEHGYLIETSSRGYGGVVPVMSALTSTENCSVCWFNPMKKRPGSAKSRSRRVYGSVCRTKRRITLHNRGRLGRKRCID